MSAPGVAFLNLYFLRDHISTFLPPLPEHPSKQDILLGLAVRDELARLFLGTDPFFRRPTLDGVRQEAEALCLAVLEQSTALRSDIDNAMQNAYTRGHLINSIESVGLHRHRPFARLMAFPFVDETLYGLVKVIALLMAEVCQNRAHDAVPEIWLGYEHWQNLGPYTKARVVLQAKLYGSEHRRREQRTREASHPSHSSAESTGAASSSHRNLPSLTHRQARRSRVSQGELRSRWA
ncbi:hypothetical protein BCR35DRAFT_355521 [Leucosporidium creatinivorum]|uniref:Uncharacterized protein n=1 Tax=Leucosporidium creatinivorum TaxID=106004 RepID=A0A1Y2DCV4_9BASI|nr:hypothetical protein BCR35DRAFT_355521 [Leucosporidium creatinivorum]